MPPKGKRGADAPSGISLTFKIIKARKLAAKDDNGLSDPYCIVKCGTVEKRTKVVPESLNPTWNAELKFVGSKCEPIINKTVVRIALYDEDRLSDDDFLGEILVPVGFLTAEDAQPHWRPVETRPGSDDFVSGEVYLSIVKQGDENAGAGDSTGGAKKLKTAAGGASKAAKDAPAIDLQPQYIIDPSELDFTNGKTLGEGSFGSVRLGEFRGLGVAVKTMILRADADKAEVVSDFKLEVEIMSKVSHHPKLCLFLGASVVEPLTVVTELMSGGSVRGLLEKAASGKPEVATYRRRLETCLDGALGMEFLHRANPPVLHRDLKCDNLLIDEHGTAKVADFGFTTTMRGTHAAEHEILGTPGFMAPEMYDDDEGSAGYETPADVFAYGMAMYEMLTLGGWPFGKKPDEVDGEVFERLVCTGKPPTTGGKPIPKDAPVGFVKLHQACVSKAPEKRPDFDTIVKELKVELGSLMASSAASAAKATAGKAAAAKAPAKKKK